ncbi:hypothetical protein HKBW3S33_01286 [Candidatus Hakubella thermalkaliphila]|uniref:Uncharacterized protein n=1 Tax=Candidatus Hakubella thermalkaliphila TaxID=2754717 RepID=A0A6V8PAM3_9ACTN|nr:hypothetical protein HKBW3S33_01286 [Candidatus Hakubella thermalkaliphila]
MPPTAAPRKNEKPIFRIGKRTKSFKVDAHPYRAYTGRMRGANIPENYIREVRWIA